MNLKNISKLFLTVFAFLTLSITSLLGIKAELIMYSTDTQAPSSPWAFCVTEDELFIIPDKQDGDIKIYGAQSRKLKLLDSLGWDESYSNQLDAPTFCFYNRTERKLAVMDFGRGRIFIYDRLGRLNFKLVGSLHCPRKGYDIQLWKDKLLISGYIEGLDKEFDLYSVRLENNLSPQKITILENLEVGDVGFLLPISLKYGLKTSGNYITRSEAFIQKKKPIGRKGWLDVLGDTAYFVWEGDLRILKISLKDREISSFIKRRNSADQEHYNRPEVTDTLREARRIGDDKTVFSEMARWSRIKDLFALSNHLLVIYSNKDQTESYRVRIYKLDGTYKKDIRLEGQPTWKFAVDKEEKVLYSLTNEGVLKYSLKLK